jgi:glucosamine--fructose-6-phosphate aminotransferase (isomerizing)
MYLATGMLAVTAAGRRDLLPAFERLPEAARRLLNTHGDLAQKLGEDPAFDRFYFLGAGLRYGLACELSLKMKEMSLSHSEPFHFMEFRHGPKSMVTRSTLVVALRSERDRAQESAVLEETAAMGATLLVLDEAETEVAFQSGVPEALRGPLYLPVGQLVACRHALAKGLNPDQPANLTAVVRL